MESRSGRSRCRRVCFFAGEDPTRRTRGVLFAVAAAGEARNPPVRDACGHSASPPPAQRTKSAWEGYLRGGSSRQAPVGNRPARSAGADGSGHPVALTGTWMPARAAFLFPGRGMPAGTGEPQRRSCHCASPRAAAAGRPHACFPPRRGMLWLERRREAAFGPASSVWSPPRRNTAVIPNDTAAGPARRNTDILPACRRTRRPCVGGRKTKILPARGLTKLHQSGILKIEIRIIPILRRGQ